MMEIKAALFDFDGTLVTEDSLDIICDLAGKKQESVELNARFHQGLMGGLQSLIQRLNLVQGISLAQIKGKLDESLQLREGAQELIAYLKEKNIVCILHSGNLVPILQHYQQLLGIDYIVGTQPNIQNGIVNGIDPGQHPQSNFKLLGCKKILYELNIYRRNVIALGNSPADRAVFDFAGVSIAVDPKGDIEKHADFVIYQDLTEGIRLIEKLAYGK